MLHWWLITLFFFACVVICELAGRQELGGLVIAEGFMFFFLYRFYFILLEIYLGLLVQSKLLYGVSNPMHMVNTVYGEEIGPEQQDLAIIWVMFDL